MAEHCIVRWEFAKQHNDTPWIGAAEDGGEKDCGVCCFCSCLIGISAGGDQEDDAFPRDNLIYDNTFELILMTLPSLHPIFPRRFPFLSLWRVHWYCANYLAILSTKSRDALDHVQQHFSRRSNMNVHDAVSSTIII